MTRGQKILASVGVLVVALGAFGWNARGEARDRARWYCEQALNERHEKDGYVFTYNEPTDWRYESPLYQITWKRIDATYESTLTFKTDAVCIFDSRAREVKAVSLAGNDLPGGTLPHIEKTLKDIGFYDKKKD